MCVIAGCERGCRAIGKQTSVVEPIYSEKRGAFSDVAGAAGYVYQKTDRDAAWD